MLSSLPSGGVPESAMIGREREFELVESSFAGARRNRLSTMVRISGESGIGKTLFLNRLASSLESKGWFVTRTSCHAIQQSTPRLAANRIVLSALERLGSDAARYTGGLEDGLARFDAQIARSIGTSRAALEIDADGYAFTFLRFFEGIIVDHDVAILCDDAQWIDDESARSILTLPQKLSIGCASVAVAERSDRDRARKWFPSADLCLTELAIEDSLRLVAAELPGIDAETAQMLAHHAGGRPIELVALCESIRTGQSADVERSFRGRIAQHLSTLEPGVREFVQLSALLSDPIEHRILLQLYPESARLEQLIEQADRYVAVGPSSLEFRHAIFAQCVAGSIAIPIPLHKRIISALESLPSLEHTDYERIAKHAAACGDRKVELDAYLRLAEVASVREAASLVIAASERALSIGGDEVRKPELLLKYVLALRIYDREPDAVDFLMRELPLLSRLSPEGLARVVSSLIIMLVELERVDQATAVYRKYVGEVDPSERFILDVPMKYGALNTLDDELFAELDVEFDALRGRASARILAFNSVIDAGYASVNGDNQHAREHVARALTYADADDPRHIHLLHFAEMMCDFRNVGLKSLSLRLPDLNAAVRGVGDIVYGKTCEAWAAFFLGDWESALRAVREYYREDMPVSRAAQLLSVPAAIAALRDSDEGFSKEIEAVCFAALERGYRQSAIQLLPWWLVRHTDAALEKFARVIVDDVAVRPPPFSVLGYFPAGLALWAAERSQTEILRSIAVLQGTRDRSNWACAHWNLTRGLAMQGLKSSDAKAPLNAAAQDFRTLSAPFFAAFAAHNAGTATPEEKQLLARLGVTKSRAASKRGATDLTPREWDVARLVGGGSTNRQIAEKLFVSERTVEVHLGNIFGKLGLSSRAQLVRWLFENEAANSASR